MLNKRYRLTKRGSFTYVYKKGEHKSGGELKITYVKGRGVAKIGISRGEKQDPQAHTRFAPRIRRRDKTRADSGVRAQRGARVDVLADRRKVMRSAGKSRVV